MTYEECNVNDCMMAAGYVGVLFQCIFNACIMHVYDACISVLYKSCTMNERKPNYDYRTKIIQIGVLLECMKVAHMYQCMDDTILYEFV